MTAKAVATLDHLSGGRAALGVGFGWNEDEIEQHGVAMRDRRAVARERVLAMQALWADDEGVVPRRARAHRAVVVVAQARAARRRRSTAGARAPRRGTPARSCSSTSPSTATAGSRSAAAASPRRCPACATSSPQAGRDPEALEIVPFGSIPDHGKLDHFEKIGVTECVFRIPSAPRDEVLPLLDRQAALIAERA